MPDQSKVLEGFRREDLFTVVHEHFQLTARITGRVKPGIAVALSIRWNKLSPGRANVNQTVSQALTDIGAGATFFDNLVEVAKT